MNERITPLPWKACEAQDAGLSVYNEFWCNVVCSLPDGSTRRVVTVTGQSKEEVAEPAAYIVHACNNYPKLEAQLKEALEEIEMLREQRNETVAWANYGEGERQMQIIEKYDAKIQKAKGGSNG